MPTDPTLLDELVTLRDWLRLAVSRFNAAHLVYGHGTSTALDEAAFLLLSALDLPIDQLEPWLDARLSRSERQRVAELISARIKTRKPAPYLVGKAWIKGHAFRVDERVIVPRSYIGELLASDGLAPVVGNGHGLKRILDLGTGSGCLAILAALAYPEAAVDAVDVSMDALTVASRNVADYGLAERIRLLQSDLFAAIPGDRYDLIIANPPYVSAAAVQAFPPEYRAEPVLAHLGGQDGLDIVRRILDNASKHLTTGGKLVVEVGTGGRALAAERPDLEFLWLDTAESEGEVFALEMPSTPKPAPAARKRGRKAGTKE